MSFWGERRHAMALVELHETGELPRRSRQEAAWDALLEIRWAQRTGRAAVLALEPTARGEVRTTLDGAWPEWEEVARRMRAAGLALTLSGFRELEQRERAQAASELELPGRMNRRTAAAVVGRHAKAGLGPFERLVVEDVDLTDDGLVRMRPSARLTVNRSGTEYDGHHLAGLLGELMLTDRAIRDGTHLRGTAPRAILTVENLGAYQDARVPDDVLVLHVPGWNTQTTRQLLDEFIDVPILHFGDLDPNGVGILLHLRRWREDIRWFVPDFWEEYAEKKALAREWPPLEFPPETPEWVRALASAGVWLEQETIVLDPRFQESLNAATGARRP